MRPVSKGHGRLADWKRRGRNDGSGSVEPSGEPKDTTAQDDRIDAKRMVRALLSYDRGDTLVPSRVRFPGVAEENRKQQSHERRQLMKQRTSLTSCMKGPLLLHGIGGAKPRSKDFGSRLGILKTGYGKRSGKPRWRGPEGSACSLISCRTGTTSFKPGGTSWSAKTDWLPAGFSAMATATTVLRPGSRC